MSHRFYPRRERALHQLARHVRAAPPRQPSEFELAMAREANAALTAMATTLRPYVEALRQAPSSAQIEAMSALRRSFQLVN